MANMMAGYETYGVTEGGDALVTFSDNADIIEDKEEDNVDIKPVNVGKDISFVRRGTSNDMIQQVLNKIAGNVTVGANIEFKNKVIIGDGIIVYRKYRDNSGKIVKEEVLPSEQPEIFDFLENNDYEDIRHAIAADLCIGYDAYVEYIFSRDKEKPKLVKINALELSCSRISVIDEKSKKSEWHGYSANWDEGSPDNVVATPLLNRRGAMMDLKQRMGMAPGKDGVARLGKQKVFVHNLSIHTPGRFYYNRPYWWSVFASGWYDFSSAIPVYKKALIKNQMTLKYMIYIRDGFWKKLYGAKGATSDAKQKEVKTEFLKDMNDFLSGEENAGKGFVADFSYDKLKGFEEKDIIIEPLKNDNIGGEYIEDSEEVSNVMSYAHGVHPSIIGASPKSKSINGTEARELFIIEQALMKAFQDATLKPLYMAKAMNGWDKDTYFGVINCQLTTLDQGTGAIKNTGLTPETEEK